jgi:hypothetical protein
VKLYAELPGLRARQLALDLVVVLAIGLCVLGGRGVHDLVDLLAGPGRTIQDAGTGFADSIDRFGDGIGRIPGVGDELRTPLDSVAGAGERLEQAGRDQQQVVHRLALVLGLVVAGIPILVVLAAWLPRRVRWMREASAAHRLRRTESGSLALFAFRAVANRPLGELRRATPDPGAALERGDWDALAALELRALGLKPLGAGR